MIKRNFTNLNIGAVFTTLYFFVTFEWVQQTREIITGNPLLPSVT